MDKELKIKKKEESKQIWTGVGPSAKWCRTCKYALKNTKFTIGAEKTNCGAYESPIDKPHEILWEDAKCPFYEKKEEA